VNSFLREHAGPLVGSTLLHVVLLAGALAAAWLAVAPKVVAPAAIEAYIAAPPAPRPRPAPVAAPEPVAEPAPPPVAEPPAPDSPAAVEARARDEAAVTAKHDEALRQEREAELRAEVAAREAARVADARRQAEAAAARRRVATEADAARRRAQAQAQAAERAAAAAADKRKADADAKQRAARESDLARELAAEEQRTGAVNAGLEARYVAEIRARIERAWNRPPTARPGLKCEVSVTQVPGGTVTDVKIGACNGDAAVQQSITLAVYRASPLPAPPDPSLFQRNLKLVFAPDA
jgi:colicin import membrane protein